MNGEKHTFHNLIDLVLSYGEKKMRSDDAFRAVLLEYFFRKESTEKKFVSFLKGFEFPPFIEVAPSLSEIDMDQFTHYVNGTSSVDSLAGKILLSKQCLKIFHQNYPPEFKKIPTDVQIALLDEVKARNDGLVSAFRKMAADRAADRARTMLTLVALIFKNIRMRNGITLMEIKRTAPEIIREIFPDADAIFRASEPQNAELTDDLKIKALIKAFCVVRRNSDLAEVTSLFKSEFGRYRIRALHAFSSVE
jgi:hypothetical protein